jgi:hypothetical protein
MIKGDKHKDKKSNSIFNIKRNRSFWTQILNIHDDDHDIDDDEDDDDDYDEDECQRHVTSNT